MVIIWTAVAVVWAILEGNLAWTVLLGTLTSLIIVIMIVKRYLTGRNLSLIVGLATMSVMGLLFGLGSALLTLLLMAIKTGLHAHGPEFSALELQWVLQQIPLWAVAGLIAGLGLGIIILALARPRH